MYDLIFWRHAQANNGINDLERELSETGKHQAALTAKWLAAQDLDWPILTSQAKRTQQTASFLREPTLVSEKLNPGQAVWSVTDFIATRDEPSLIIVGHQPWIGQAIGYYLAGDTSYYGLSTSDLWWLRSEDAQQWTLHQKVINSALEE